MLQAGRDFVTTPLRRRIGVAVVATQPPEQLRRLLSFLCCDRSARESHASPTVSVCRRRDRSLLATVDGLIMTRVLLDLRGAAVVAGISFSADAGRRTWSDIQQYLSNHCGMVLEPDLPASDTTVQSRAPSGSRCSHAEMAAAPIAMVISAKSHLSFPKLATKNTRSP